MKNSISFYNVQKEKDDHKRLNILITFNFFILGIQFKIITLIRYSIFIKWK